MHREKLTSSSDSAKGVASTYFRFGAHEILKRVRVLILLILHGALRGGREAVIGPTCRWRADDGCTSRHDVSLGVFSAPS